MDFHVNDYRSRILGNPISSISRCIIVSLNTAQKTALPQDFPCGRARTLEEVGKEFKVTRERIRQIEAKALRKLRHPSRSRKLKDYLE